MASGVCVCALLSLPPEDICGDGLEVKQCICNLKHSLLSPQVRLDERHRVHLALQTVPLGHPKHSDNIGQS